MKKRKNYGRIEGKRRYARGIYQENKIKNDNQNRSTRTAKLNTRRPRSNNLLRILPCGMSQQWIASFGCIAMHLMAAGLSLTFRWCIFAVHLLWLLKCSFVYGRECACNVMHFAIFDGTVCRYARSHTLTVSHWVLMAYVIFHFNFLENRHTM